MNPAAMLRGTVAVSLFLAVLALVVSAAAGHFAIGIGMGAGLAIGCTNGYLMIATLNQRAPFVAASIFRLGLLTGAGIMAAFILHATPWAVILGIAVAQVALTVSAVREGLRA